MENYKRKVREASDYIHSRVEQCPRVGLLTGTGLAQSTEGLKISGVFDYQEIPI